MGQVESTTTPRHYRERRNKLDKALTKLPSYTKPQEPGYELSIKGQTDKQIRDRNLRNQDKRVAWKNQRKHLDNLGPTVDGIPWEEADIKCRSYI